MTFHIISLFPESLDSYINSSIIGRAIRDKKIKIKFYNPRSFVKPTKSQKKNERPYLRVDNKPYGGGAGMVIEAIPVLKAIEKSLPHPRSLSLQRREKPDKTLIIWLTPSGKQFDNTLAEKISKKYTHAIIICGRYEGIDARVKEVIKDFRPKIDLVEISVGPYVVTGGELPAMIILDTISRRIPGVLGKIESVEENRVASSDVYTRPEILEYRPQGKAGKTKKYRVPKVLVSGNHKKIEEWRKGK